MHMEHWSTGHDLEDEHTGRILSLATGNSQTLPVVSKHDTDFNSQPRDLEREASRSFYTEHQSTPYPTSLVTNTNYDLKWKRHAFRRLRRRFEVSLLFQQRPEYLRYRDRSRKDTDKDGQVIWTDAIEAAFTNALVNIPPMGRRKRPQHGKSFGRNELLTEWMLQETGILRKRKQISSHIQVLDKVFLNFPPWAKLTKTPDGQAAPEPELYEYYNESIADMVRNWPALKALLIKSLLPNQRTLLTAPILKSNDSFSDRHPLDHLVFDMWIGPSTNVDRCLHRYTRTAHHDASFGKMTRSLESIDGWRQRFPTLESIIAGSSATEDCDVVLVDARLHMMTDFPFEHVKLGINFQLDFCTVGCKGVHEPGCMEAFGCITQIYQSGELLRQTEANKCQVVGHGKVKPPFESQWWAPEFVRLTDYHRMAEDAGNEADIATAKEATTRFLDELTIVQQIFMSSGSFRNYLPESSVKSQRQNAVILLWTFSQASSDGEAVTVPYKLILPKVRKDGVENSLPDPMPTSLHLMDTTENPMTIGLYDDGYGGETRLDPNMMQKDRSDSEELCQDGFMITAQQENLNTDVQFLNSADGIEHSKSEFQFGHGLQQPVPLRTTEDALLHASLYESLDTLNPHDSHAKQKPSGIFSNVRDFGRLAKHSDGYSRKRTGRIPLEHFDSSTHDLLQAQLKNLNPNVGSADGSGQIDQSLADGHDSIRHSLTQQDKGLSVEVPQMSTTDMLWNSLDGTTNLADIGTLTPRPVLQHYHSFAGLLHTEDDRSDTPRRAFNKFVEQMEQGPVTQYVQNTMTNVNSHETGRAHSQPAPDLRFSNGEWLLQDIDINNDWTNIDNEEMPSIDNKHDLVRSLCL